jgi:hypothetical protein
MLLEQEAAMAANQPQNPHPLEKHDVNKGPFLSPAGGWDKIMLRPFWARKEIFGEDGSGCLGHYPCFRLDIWGDMCF